MFKRIFAILLASFFLLGNTVSALAEPVPIPVEITSAPETVPDNPSSELPNPDSSTVVSEETPLQSELPESANSSQPEPEQPSSEVANSEIISSEPSRQNTTKPNSSTHSEPPEPNNSQWSEGLAITLSLACDWVRNSEKGSLYFLCMGSAGKPAVSRTVNQYITDVSLKTEYEEAVDLAYDILNVTFCGYSAENVLGKDLIDTLSSYPNFDQKDIYTIAYSLLAIDSNQYEIPQVMKNSRENLKAALLSYQGTSGGFFSQNPTDGENVSQTALAVAALAPYREEPEVSAAIDQALNFLVEHQAPEGGYYENGGISSVAISRTIIALNCLEIPMSDPRFMHDQKTLLSILLDYVNLDSGFAEHIGEESDVYATERAILALTSVKKQGSPYRLANPLTNSSSENLPNTVIQESNKEEPDWIFKSIYLLWGALVVTLIASFVLIKIHPIRRSQYYQKRHSAQNDAENHSNQQDEILHSENPQQSDLNNDQQKPQE